MFLIGKRKIIFLTVVLMILVNYTEAKKKQFSKHAKGMTLRQKETNAINFIRLAVMRLIYGVATRIGMGEQISDALNGAFVPPGVEDYNDYEDDGLFAREDYDY